MNKQRSRRNIADLTLNQQITNWMKKSDGTLNEQIITWMDTTEHRMNKAESINILKAILI